MSNKVLMKGNEVIAEAAIRAGCKCYFGYPITPQTEVLAYMANNIRKRGGEFVQAESELAAINMVYGAAGTGVIIFSSIRIALCNRRRSKMWTRIRWNTTSSK